MRDCNGLSGESPTCSPYQSSLQPSAAAGVDFGHWKSIRTDQLVCPLDVHAVRVARKLGLLQRQQVDWKAALELTEALREIDLNDPVKYDFALFGLGVSGEW